DPAAVLTQHPADRLDPEAVAMVVDERDQRLDWRSSSAPKKADAALRISFARRSSLFSRSSCLIRSRSSVVTPSRRPWSTSARRTHTRRVSRLMSSFSAIEQIAFHCDGYSCWCSKTFRTARSRSSAGFLCPLGSAGIAPASEEKEQSAGPGRFIEAFGSAIESAAGRG